MWLDLIASYSVAGHADAQRSTHHLCRFVAHVGGGEERSGRCGHGVVYGRAGMIYNMISSVSTRMHRELTVVAHSKPSGDGVDRRSLKFWYEYRIL